MSGCGAKGGLKANGYGGDGGSAGGGAGGGAGSYDSRDAAAFVPPVFIDALGAPKDYDPGAVSEPLVVPPKWGGKETDPMLGSDPSSKFEAANPTTSTTLKIVYPMNASLHPVNITDMTFQWTGERMATTYRIQFTNDRGTFDVFAPCMPDGMGRCAYQFPEAVWQKIAVSNPGKEVTATVTALRSDGTAISSAPIKITFSPQRVEGGLYYWSTSLQGTYRLTFGQRKASPFITPPAKACYGCHAVSRNGNTIAWTAYDNTSLRIAATEQPDQVYGGSDVPGGTVALNPDGSRVLTSANGTLAVRDNTGKELSKFGPEAFGNKGVYFPEWSPDGKSIAVTIGPQKEGRDNDSDTDDLFLADASVGVIPFVSDTQLGTLRTLVAKNDKDVSYYPSWSPDGKWLVFASAPTGSRGNPTANPATYNNPNARLRLVDAEGKGPIYELGAATQGLNKTASWPKFTPFVQLGGKLLFITYGSRLGYGWKLPDGTRPQLWLAAIDLRKLEGNGADPSWAPMWLPFQELDQSNHLGFWTEKVTCRSSTGEGQCGEGATCYQGRCILPVE